MATTKNITMKQFNGTDYDTLYPKTKVEQVENLTPSSIGAVNKSGDTMTGSLEVPGLNVSYDACLGRIYGSLASLTLQGGNPYTEDLHKLHIKDSGVYVDGNLVCHEGNLLSIGSTMGIARIATGSYVGTGNCGVSNPTTVEVGFMPKFFWICLKITDRNGESVAYTIPGGSTEDSNGLFIYPFTKYFCSPGTNSQYYVTVTWGPRMSWYGSLESPDKHGEFQFNEAGVTYYWVAIG